MEEIIIAILRESADLKLKLAKDSIGSIVKAVDIIKKCLKSGGKILIFGNGGSAADAQHLAAEFVNRFTEERKAIPAIALTTDSSVITSISNDRGFDEVFSRQIEAIGSKNDVAIGFTTSGESFNVINALQKSKSMGITNVVLCGKNIKKLKKHSDCVISVPSDSTPRIQEIHITIAHIICDLIEREIKG